MSVAIALRLDAATSALIDAIRDALPDRLTGKSYRPRLKLAVFDDPVDVTGLEAALATATAEWRRVPISLAGIGVFAGEPATLWLAVTPTADLLTIHATLHAAIDDHPRDPRYKVGAWLPHVVVATTEFLPDAVEVLACCWTGSINGSLESLDLVRIETGEIISSRPLRS